MSTQLRFAGRTLIELPSFPHRSSEAPHDERIQTVETKTVAAAEALTSAADEATRILDYQIDDPDYSDDEVRELIAVLITITETRSHLERAQSHCRRLEGMRDEKATTGYPSLEAALDGAEQALTGGQYGYAAVEDELQTAREEINDARQYLQDFRERRQAQSKLRRVMLERTEGDGWIQRLRTGWVALIFAAIIIDLLTMIAESIGIAIGVDMQQAVVNPLLIGAIVILAGLFCRYVVLRAQYALQD